MVVALLQLKKVIRVLSDHFFSAVAIISQGNRVKTRFILVLIP